MFYVGLSANELLGRIKRGTMIKLCLLKGFENLCMLEPETKRQHQLTSLVILG